MFNMVKHCGYLGPISAEMFLEKGPTSPESSFFSVLAAMRINFLKYTLYYPYVNE